MSNIEEHFAPNANDNSDNESISSVESVESVEMPVKRYATRSQNASTVIKHLKEENLKIIKNKLKKDESEQIRYLSLDNATKDIEIMELKEKIQKYENLLSPIQEYEKVLKNIDKNIETYKLLIEKLNINNYKELMDFESQEIITVTLPENTSVELETSIESLNTVYTIKKNNQDKNRDNFRDKLFWTGFEARRNYYKYIEFVVGFIMFYFTLYFYFGK
uniref:Uncharacterized protein n=1 Tax=viral metagenome TaxID=1070528 RepID=A0A6C0D6C1_9ZZZZ